MSELSLTRFKRCCKCKMTYPRTPAYFHRNTQSDFHPYCRFCKVGTLRGKAWALQDMTGWVAPRTCTKCGEVKPGDAFSLRRRYNRPMSQCMECVKEHKRKHRNQNAQEKAESVRRAFLRSKFGISVGDYARMLHEQGGVCAICKGVNKSGRRLNIDHCHETQRIRGLLCFRCNAGLGQFRDRLDLLKAAVEYLG